MQGIATTSPIALFKGSVPTPVGLHPAPRQSPSQESIPTFGGPISDIPDIPEVIESPSGHQYTRIDNLPKPNDRSNWKNLRNKIRIGRRSDTASIASMSLANDSSSIGHIDLRHLQQDASGEIKVTLSVDCERLIIWNNTKLALYDVSDREAIRELMPEVSPANNPDIVLASKGHYAIVRRGPSYDEASIPSKRNKITTC
jgi:hypothetical protein